MRNRLLLPIAAAAVALLLVAGLTAGSRTISAQDASPSPTTMEGSMAHPAHIHAGTCETLGEVIFPLSDVAAPSMDGTPAASMESTPMIDMMASPGPEREVVAESTTTVPAALADIISGGHAINVHESVENIANYIACGDITGTPMENELEIELGELNDSGYEGKAVLTDNGDGSTTVVVHLMHVEDGMSTPVASPTM
jgi:hypothetical protein